MIGIPYRIVRHGDKGPEDKVFYLATRRSGEAGAAMKKTKREFQKAELATAKAAQRYQAASAAEHQDEELLCNLLEDIQLAGQAADDAAEHLVLLSLTENYGRENAEAVLDQLTDTDIKKMVSVIETGELPKDFFESSGQPPKPTSTLQPGGSPPAPSSSADTQPGKLPAAT
jgi:flagellar motor protein MotB